MQRGFKQAAERRAVELRTTLHLPATAPLPARCLAGHMRVPIIGPQQVPGMSHAHLEQLLALDDWSWSAATVPVDDWALVICNSAHPADRFESDVMHELAHLLCEHQPARLVSLPGFPFPLREFDAEQEAEAVWQAGCLQIPRPALAWALRRGMDTGAIASFFGSSEDIVRYRRNVTGIDRQIAATRRGLTRSTQNSTIW